MRVEDRSGSEKADAGDDLSRNARGVAVWAAIRREADLRDANRQMREKRRADADEYVRTKPGWLPGDLTLEADGAAEQRREQQLEQQGEPQRLAHRAERILGESVQKERRGEQSDYRPPRRSNDACAPSARIEIANVAGSCIGRRISIGDAAGLILELSN